MRAKQFQKKLMEWRKEESLSVEFVGMNSTGDDWILKSKLQRRCYSCHFLLLIRSHHGVTAIFFAFFHSVISSNSFHFLFIWLLLLVAKNVMKYPCRLSNMNILEPIQSSSCIENRSKRNINYFICNNRSFVIQSFGYYVSFFIISNDLWDSIFFKFA